MNTLTAKRALEALRNGVPNAYAVQALGCMQPEALDRFREQLERLAPDSGDGEPPFVRGMLLAAGFGAGKSHTLSFFEQEALARNFVVSRLVISKETPLHNPAKVFQAAVREARLPNSRGSLLHELAPRVDYHSDEGVKLLEWCKNRQPYGILAASVAIDAESNNGELKDQIVHWWSGESLKVTAIRQGLREIGKQNAYQVNAVAQAELAPIRFRFAVRLARAAGFRGWVLLFDELELVARYSLLQRAKSYAELARWLGAVPDQGVPGLVAVGAMSSDFANVLQERNDDDLAPDRLTQKGDQKSLAQAMMARKGIEAITAKDVVSLTPPNDDSLKVSYEVLRELYESAYGVRPQRDFAPEGERHRAMRSYVRRWINDWDLDRLYGQSERTTVEETLFQDYSEQPELNEEPQLSAGEVE